MKEILLGKIVIESSWTYELERTFCKPVWQENE